MVEARARRHTLPYRAVFRAQIVLLAAQGLRNAEIAERLNSRREVARMWRKRFFHERLLGLEERPRSDRPDVFPPGGSGDDGAAPCHGAACLLDC